MSLAIALHMLAAVVWVGGMFFAYVVLRPTAVELFQSPERLRLWLRVFERFFPWVKVAIVLLLVTGFWVIHGLGGFANVGWHVHLMLTLGLIMFAVFGHINWASLKKLRNGVIEENWAAAGAALGQIRQLVGLNLILGLIVTAVAAAGRYPLWS